MGPFHFNRLAFPCCTRALTVITPPLLTDASICTQPYFVAAVFSFATGAAKDIQTVLITRFFAGFFGSAPVANTGGVLGDIWAPEQRGVAVSGYAIAVVGGPTIGPLVGGAISSSYLRWRWTEYLMA